MPEQLSKYPDVTLQVLRSAGARCGEGAPQAILTACPTERFCKLPGGEVCVYGLSDAAKMTQITSGDWSGILSLLSREAASPFPPLLSGSLPAGGVGLLLGLALGLMAARLQHRRRRARAQGDEREIRQLVSTWMAASKAGDVETVLSLMADDAVFLVPGQPVMRKADFAAAARAQAGQEAPRFDGTSEIQEIEILGDCAFMWTRLAVVVTPPGGATPMTRTGHTLSILKKQDGKWVLARDANMLSPVSSTGQ